MPIALPPKALIGMIHVGALPGTPRSSLAIPEICQRAREEALVLREAGFDALLVENMHDTPYLKREVGPEIVAAMTAATAAVVQEAGGLPVGVQVLAGANRAALAVALAAGASFIRAEGFVFAHVADEGLIESDAGELLRYRKQIGAGHISVLADIKKKHASHALTSDITLAETARAAEFFGADGVIVTGTATGDPVRPADLAEAAAATALPVLVGSGATPDNLPELWPRASGIIVGSWIKEGGLWSNPLDRNRAEEFVRAAREK